ncbi:AMP-binding protein [Aquimarina sp. LLG6339-5]|uniref:AMP-binding protein n=1 Tax=Aquimarina sp. LLG6339-5 TaxID=3160830 RepID=UPI00386B1B74
MDVFWIDNSRDIRVSYDDLLEELVKEGDNNLFIYELNPYKVFVKILRNLLSEKRCIILDADFSNDELTGLGISEEDFKNASFFQEDLRSKFNSFDEILNFLKSSENNLDIEIYTSGTTGRPKKVEQSFKNIIRAVKVDPDYKGNNWGFAYNPTHFAGLQVFFQALFNKNKLVYIFDKDYSLIYNDIYTEKVSHLSCTPTFIKMLLPNIIEPVSTLQNLTFGGEKFDPRVQHKIKEKFPNTSVKNVYASTEAGSLLRAKGENFLIPARYQEFIKIEEDELMIHKQLLGKSESFTLEGEWYKTGDLVEFVDENSFRFKTRKSEMINVGGYKVNPKEVEEVIKDVKGVNDAIVFGRKNSVLGYIIAANVIKEENEDKKELKHKIKKTCENKLQEFKIPRIIKFVDSFEVTRTGKIKRT